MVSFLTGTQVIVYQLFLRLSKYGRVGLSKYGRINKKIYNKKIYIGIANAIPAKIKNLIKNKMNPFLKIDKRINRLNTTDAFIYFMLVYAKFTNKQISRAYLATCLGFKKEENDYITRCLKRIEDTGLIKRNILFSKAHKGNYITKHLSYELIYEYYFMITLNLVTYDFDPKLKGFLLQLRSLCYDNTLNICFSKTEIAKQLHISRTTLDKRMNALKDLGLLEMTEDIFLNRNDLTFLSDKRTDELNQILLQANKDSKLYKQASWFVENDIQYEKDANKIYDEMIAGLLGKKN